MENFREKEGTTLHSLCGRTIIRYDNIVVKAGHLRSHEAQTLQFIATATSIPVPKIHDVHYDGDRVVAIVMDYIPGKPLDEAWDDLYSHQKLAIANELHSYMEQLRALKGDYVGAINRGKAIIGQIASIEGGPFDSEQQFNEFILGDMVTSAPDLLRHYAKFALSDHHQIVFTHSDFAPRNILVEGGHVAAIIDWEYAGWYPEHWEYVQALRHLRPMPDWPEYLAQILPPRFEKEYIGLSFLARLMRH